jgi:hypothetical protein
MLLRWGELPLLHVSLNLKLRRAARSQLDKTRWRVLGMPTACYVRLGRICHHLLPVCPLMLPVSAQRQSPAISLCGMRHSQWPHLHANESTIVAKISRTGFPLFHQRVHPGARPCILASWRDTWIDCDLEGPPFTSSMFHASQHSHQGNALPSSIQGRSPPSTFQGGGGAGAAPVSSNPAHPNKCSCLQTCVDRAFRFSSTKA